MVYEPNYLSVRTAEINFETIRFEEDFTFREDRGWWWLQRACFAILRRIGACRADEMVEITTYRDIHHDNLYEAIIAAIEDGYRRDRRPEMFIVGGETWREMIGSPDNLEGLIEYPLQGDRIHGTSVLLAGVPVKVVPWIKGFALI